MNAPQKGVTLSEIFILSLPKLPRKAGVRRGCDTEFDNEFSGFSQTLEINESRDFENF